MSNLVTQGRRGNTRLPPEVNRILYVKVLLELIENAAHLTLRTCPSRSPPRRCTTYSGSTEVFAKFACKTILRCLSALLILTEGTSKTLVVRPSWCMMTSTMPRTQSTTSQASTSVGGTSSCCTIRSPGCNRVRTTISREDRSMTWGVDMALGSDQYMYEENSIG